MIDLAIGIVAFVIVAGTVLGTVAAVLWALRALYGVLGWPYAVVGAGVAAFLYVIL